MVLEKGRSAVEQYLIGRYHMFQNVYLHKTSRGFETAFRGLCRRLQHLGPRTLPAGARDGGVVRREPESGTLSHAHRLALPGGIDALATHEDPTVRALVRALRHRIPLSALSSSEGVEALSDELGRRRELAAQRGLDPECAVWLDRAAETCLSPLLSARGKEGTARAQGERRSRRHHGTEPHDLGARASGGHAPDSTGWTRGTWTATETPPTSRGARYEGCPKSHATTRRSRWARAA